MYSRCPKRITNGGGTQRRFEKIRKWKQGKRAGAPHRVWHQRNPQRYSKSVLKIEATRRKTEGTLPTCSTVKPAKLPLQIKQPRAVESSSTVAARCRGLIGRCLAALLYFVFFAGARPSVRSFSANLHCDTEVRTGTRSRRFCPANHPGERVRVQSQTIELRVGRRNHLTI